jgi:hypothetical protein
MKSENKNKAVADKIIEILRSGLMLNAAAQHYIDSTFSNPPIDRLATLVKEDTNCETDSLVELLLFPDESIQLQLEEIIEAGGFEKHDELAIQELVCDQLFRTRIYFPDGRGSFAMAVSPSNVAQFTARLNLSRPLNAKLRSAIAQYVAPPLQVRCKVRLRNAKPIGPAGHIQFLMEFFKKMQTAPGEFLDALDFILSILDELEDEPHMFEVLMAKKRFYFWSLQKAENLDMQLMKHNMETLLLKGKRVSYVDKADARKKIRLIDRISLAVFGKTESFDLTPAEAQSMTLEGKDAIEKLFHELS